MWILQEKIKYTAFTNRVLGNNLYYRILPPCTTSNSNLHSGTKAHFLLTIFILVYQTDHLNGYTTSRLNTAWHHTAQPWQTWFREATPSPVSAYYQASTLFVSTVPWGNWGLPLHMHCCSSDILCKACLWLRTSKTPQSVGKRSKATPLRISHWFW